MKHIYIFFKTISKYNNMGAPVPEVLCQDTQGSFYEKQFICKRQQISPAKEIFEKSD